ncbi:tail fiber domain-containing protein, partial [Candidatus Parcubacteria bacterium]|nr:tail fiber domain-containing protein [Candidatus Parcubacteria bacterium]
IPVAFSLIFFLSILVYAQWNPPSASPPSGNVPPPINVGSTNQAKTGKLGVQTSGVDSNYALTVGAGIKITNTTNQPTFYAEDRSSDPTPFIIDQNGNVGIGTTNPQYKLHVVTSGNWATRLQTTNGYIDFGPANTSGAHIYTNTPRFYFNKDVVLVGNPSVLSAYSTNNLQLATNSGQNVRLTILASNGNVGIGTTAPSYKLHVVGNVGATAYYYTSDIAKKTDIYPLENSLEKILKLQGVSFVWKDTGQPSIGLIAQDVEKVFPEVVSGKEGEKTIDYGRLIAPLIEAIKEQQKEIEQLKAKISDLEARLK